MFQSQGIHTIPHAHLRVIVSRTVVIQPGLLVKLLAVVLVWLEVRIHHGRRVGVWCAERIVARHLVHDTTHCHRLAVVAEVVLVEIVEHEPVGRRACLEGPGKTALEEQLVHPAVNHNEASPEEVIRGVRAQYLRGGKLPGAADGNSDVRHHLMCFVQIHCLYLLSCCGIKYLFL